MVSELADKELTAIFERLNVRCEKLTNGPRLAEELTILSPSCLVVQPSYLTDDGRRALLSSLSQTPRKLLKLPGGSFPGASTPLRLPITELNVCRGLNAVLQSSEDDARQARPKVRQLQILVADDNPINLKVMIRLLEKEGHTVDGAMSGAEVLRKVDDKSYDLILMDVQMPEGNGYETTEKIRLREARTGSESIAIVALTARATREDRERAKESGMNHYLSKPVPMKTLNELLRIT